MARLHTLKQSTHLEVARRVHWDILVVDEAHYLRNRDSQAWQAVNALTRQFLLLLTATPVQNSLEELYNLVTLLRPGQLPTPKEFRARFLEPKRPRQPRQPEERRRLLGQVMIRNTCANPGVELPPRRAKTVSLAPGAEENAFWQPWETEFRSSLQQFSRSEASLWGGVVIFTQFLETQAALAEFLEGEKVQASVINGATPAAHRQPITEEFRQHGGALLLTHSGAEGRNLQFCHRLVNSVSNWRSRATITAKSSNWTKRALRRRTSLVECTNMNGDVPNMDVLQNLEFAVVQLWRAHPEMIDYVALRAYDAAFQHYRSELRDATPKPADLSGLDAETFEAVKAMCEFRLGRNRGAGQEETSIPPVSLQVIVDCLRKLTRSVEHNTRIEGRRGYLTFIERFVSLSSNV